MRTTCKAGLQNNIHINDNSICIPLVGNEGDLKGEPFIPVYKTVVQVCFL
jgi:hypothetical protein